MFFKIKFSLGLGLVALVCGLLLAPKVAEAGASCTYQTFTWNTRLKKSVDWVKIEKPYEELSEVEIDQFTGCSVCEQDQRTITISPLKSFRVCHVVALEVERILRQLLEQSEPIKQVIGYRVGKTRGKADSNGLRTQFSNHSFGIAIDINSANNGLYNNCLSFGPQCRLTRGGQWDPENPESLLKHGATVRELNSIGLKWGGEIQGWQKDFMHFSPSGY